MPVWNEKLEKYVRDGKLVVLWIAQEHPPQRNRLFTQWHGIGWTVLHDPINVMQVSGVPVIVAIDEYGIVRSTRVKAETLERDFINKTFSAKGAKAGKPVKAKRPDLAALRGLAEQTRSADAWRDLGDMKRDLLDLWTEERSAYAKGVMTDIEKQRRQREEAK